MIAWLPTASDDVLKVATPLAFRVTVPSDVVPSTKVTLPVGTAEPFASARCRAVGLLGDEFCATVAVRLRLLPATIEVALA